MFDDCSHPRKHEHNPTTRYISGLGLSQSIMMSIFVAQQISFSLPTKAGLLGSLQREELSDFSDSWDIFAFKAAETPMRGDYNYSNDGQQRRFLSEINITTTESPNEISLPNFTAADLQDALFWYLLVIFCFGVLRIVSYVRGVRVL